MELQILASQLPLVNPIGQFDKPLDIVRVVERQRRSKLIDPEGQFKSILSQVVLIACIVLVSLGRHTNDRVVAKHQLLPTLDAESDCHEREKNGDQSSGGGLYFGLAIVIELYRDAEMV